MKRPFTLWILIGLTFLIGISALISGPMLFLEPSGRLMQWSVEDLQGTPFGDFLIPGIVLFVFIGIYPLFVTWCLLRRPPWRWPDAMNPCKGYHWACAASWSVGIIMLIWIIVETALLGLVSFLQPVIAGWAVLVLLLSFLPEVRRYYRRAG